MMLYLADSDIECGKCYKPIRLYKDNGSVFVIGATYEAKCPYCKETSKYIIGILLCRLSGIESNSSLPSHATKALPLNGESSDINNMPQVPTLAVSLD